MMQFYIRPLKAVVDLHGNHVVHIPREKDVPWFIPIIDLLYADPMITRTQTCATWPSAYEPQRILLALSSYDLMTVLTAVGMIWEHKGKKFTDRAIRKLFYRNADEAIRCLVRTACPELAAPGDCSYFRRVQLDATPELWAAFHASRR